VAGDGGVVAAGRDMEPLEEEAFDITGFLKLLDEVMRNCETGVVSARIHVRDGTPWAMAVEFEPPDAKAA
jgi:hypothetical protein